MMTSQQINMADGCHIENIFWLYLSIILSN